MGLKTVANAAAKFVAIVSLIVSMYLVVIAVSSPPDALFEDGSLLSTIFYRRKDYETMKKRNFGLARELVLVQKGIARHDVLRIFDECDEEGNKNSACDCYLLISCLFLGVRSVRDPAAPSTTKKDIQPPRKTNVIAQLRIFYGRESSIFRSSSTVLELNITRQESGSSVAYVSYDIAERNGIERFFYSEAVTVWFDDEGIPERLMFGSEPKTIEP